MKTLVSMTDFVISQIKTDSSVNDSFKKDLADIRNYALFLKQPLTLGMFVPCDNKGNILNNPQAIDEDVGTEKEDLQIQYNNALDRVLFKGFTLMDGGLVGTVINNDDKRFYLVGYYNQTIEDKINHNLELSGSAIKQIFGKP